MWKRTIVDGVTVEKGLEGEVWSPRYGVMVYDMCGHARPDRSLDSYFAHHDSRAYQPSESGRDRIRRAKVPIGRVLVGLDFGQVLGLPVSDSALAGEYLVQRAVISLNFKWALNRAMCCGSGILRISGQGVLRHCGREARTCM